jgi:glycosyltransferase involved in cell wall biosynthesis
MTASDTRKESALKIALINETYSKKMGYAENCLSKAFAKLGMDVHLIVLPVPPYYYMTDFKKTYGDFNALTPETPEECVDGYTVHYLKPAWRLGRIRMRGLGAKLGEIAPHIVQTFSVNSWIPLEAALSTRRVGYKFFTGTSYQASVFPLANRPSRFWEPERLHAFLLREVPGRYISSISELCYGATNDCSEVAVRFFGVSKSKIRTDPLGVDTEVFFPSDDPAERARTRAEFGFADAEIVCIYTGRFAVDKNPLLLAKAVEKLRREGEPYRALFFGSGTQQAAIEACDGAIVHPFVDYTQLGKYYRASDIGVWPTQESTSMLDAAACGLPLVVNDTLTAKERIDGNGLAYRLNDLDDLARALRALRAPETRRAMGRNGAEKIAGNYSWESIARGRLKDYCAALRKP